MIVQILKYFRYRKMRVPNLIEAMIWLTTEIGEAFDAAMRTGFMGEGWVRNNPDKQASLVNELADIYMMTELAAHAINLDLRAQLRLKMKRAGFDLSEDFIPTDQAFRIVYEMALGSAMDFPQETTVQQQLALDTVHNCLP